MTTTNDETAVLPGLSAELAAAAPKRWWNRGTVGLGVAAVLLAGFLGGVQAQEQWGSSEPSPTRGGGFAPAGAPAAGTTGKVKLVDGTTIYVETSDGTVVTVRTDDDTAVTTAKKGKLADVRAGDSVTVDGPAGTDGTVTATAVTRR